MKEIKKGDIVGRKSYGKDILFEVSRIIETKQEDIAILTGIIDRIQADSKISDLEKIETKEVKKVTNEYEEKVKEKISKTNRQKEKDYKIGIITNNKRTREKIVTGKILHLDGDRKYSEKSYRYYKKIGLNAVVKNVPEYRQPRVVYRLLEIYKPDILVITGHDGMIKNGRNYNDIYNYRNSKYFIETVREARRYDKEKSQKLVIFAGACQSYFEAIISAGANFASSPARILIDFLDPLVVAKNIAIADKNKYITIDDFVDELRDGKRGINGLGALGKKNVMFL